MIEKALNGRELLWQAGGGIKGGTISRCIEETRFACSPKLSQIRVSAMTKEILW